MKLSDLKVDSAKGDAGAWVTNIPDLGEVALKVRSQDTADFEGLYAKLYEAVPRAKKVGGRLAPEEQNRLLNQCIVATCLLDWRGLKNDDGTEIPFDKKLAADLLSNRDFAAFRAGVLYAVAEVSRQGVETIEAAAGN